MLAQVFFGGAVSVGTGAGALTGSGAFAEAAVVEVMGSVEGGSDSATAAAQEPVVVVSVGREVPQASDSAVGTDAAARDPFVVA